MSDSQHQLQIPKTKEQYSRNVKILKLQLQKLESELETLRFKMANAHSIDNDRLLAMRFSKYCKIRKMTPEMLFRFSDVQYRGEIDETDWRHTLKSLGFNLTADEIHKITLLIDEDLSGKITSKEYTEYLEAFNINTETPARLVPQGMKGAGVKDLGKMVGKDRMISWEEFYKYVKGLFPLMKEKDLIKIFNKLDPHNKGEVSMNELNRLLERLMKEEDRDRKEGDNRQKTQEKSKTKQEELKKQVNKKDSMIIEDGQPVNMSDVQSRIRLLLKHRKWKSLIFHLLEFREIGEKLRVKSAFIQFFKDIDSPKIGSFNYNDIIRHYLDQKPPKDKYSLVYEIVKSKLGCERQSVQEFLFRYNLRDNSDLKEQQFVDMFQEHFEIPENHCRNMYKELLAELPENNKQLTTATLIAQFQCLPGEKSTRPDLNNLVELNFYNTTPQDFLRKGTGTIVFSPFLALRFCLHLESKILEHKKSHWMDPDFGVTFQDRSGLMSIAGKQVVDVNFGLNEEDVTWMRCGDLQMAEFYDGYSSASQSGRIPNFEFLSSLAQLPQHYSNFLWKETNLSILRDKLTEKDLTTVFSGIYPKAFHYFAKYGIYVFRYFINHRWVYALVDDYIPVTTSTSKQPLFSSAKTSWVSLIEKGYAKVEQSYASMLSRQSIYEVIYELSHLAPTDMIVPPETAEVSFKERFWSDLMKIFSDNSEILVSCFNDSNKGRLSCCGIETQLQGEESAQIIGVIEIVDGIIDNSHQSHRLVILQFNSSKTIDDTTWNNEWSRHVQKNQLSLNDDAIEKSLNRRKMHKVVAQLALPNVIVLNYKRFRSLYDRLYFLEDLESQNRNAKVTLDRMLKDDSKYTSEFRLASRMKSDVVLAFAKREEKQLEITIMFGELNKRPILRKVTTEDFCFVKIPEISANVEYSIFVTCNKEPVDFYLTFYLATMDYSLRKCNGPAKFHNVKKVEEICREYNDTDPKVKEYLDRKLFNVEHKRKIIGCCG